MTAIVAANAETKPLVCTRLRTKGGWVPYGERVTWDSGFIINAIFWCIETADPVGPDDGPVHPHRCIAGRHCYSEAPTCDTGHPTILSIGSPKPKSK